MAVSKAAGLLFEGPRRYACIPWFAVVDSFVYRRNPAGYKINADEARGQNGMYLVTASEARGSRISRWEASSALYK